MMYPIVILTVTVIAFFGIMLFIMPKIGKILTDLGGPNAKLPIYTQVLLNFSHILPAATPSSSSPLIVVLYLRQISRATSKRPTANISSTAYCCACRSSRVIITKVAIARFSRTFASLMSAGVSVLDALAVTGGAIGNKVIEKELAAAAEEVKNGKQLSRTDWPPARISHRSCPKCWPSAKKPAKPTPYSLRSPIFTKKKCRRHR